MELFGHVILPEGVLRSCRVVCEEGRIRDIIPCPKRAKDPLPYLAPGYIDIHNHGAVGCDYMQGTDRAFDAIRGHLTRHGVTCTQPTTVSAPVEQLRDFFRAYRDYQARADESLCVMHGIHVEGPYLAPAAKGAHPLSTLLVPERDGWDWVLENKDIITQITVAPELAGMEEMIAQLAGAGILVSGGHDAAEPEDIERAARAGMAHCTHIYCAMSTLHKTDGHRRHGLCEYAMTHDSLTAEMIADNHHVPPLLARMIHRAKGPDRVCLVSDAIAPAGLAPSDTLYSLGTGEDCTQVLVEEGVAMVADRSCYAGSIQALDRMVRNMVFDAGLPLADAVRMASLTPARILGLDRDRGSIQVGKRADLCVLDENLNVTKTLIAGKVVWEKGE